MSSVQYLTNFVNERLTAAVEDILSVFKRCVVEYEAEIDRQRRLLDVFCKPEVKLHRIELPDQQLCSQQLEEPPHIKEEQEELLCTTQGGQQLELKQETGYFMLTPTEKSEDQTLLLNPAETLSAAHKLSHNLHAAERTDHIRYRRGKSKSSTGEKSFKCNTCGDAFMNNYSLKTHLVIHRGRKQCICNICGKAFMYNSALKRHLMYHTGEKQCFCDTCGKGFCEKSNLKKHIRIHTGEKPYVCKTCGRCFIDNSSLAKHRRTTHIEEKT